MPALSEAAASPLAQSAFTFWRWWTTELAAMVPTSLRPGPRSRATADIWLSATGVTVDRSIGGESERFEESAPLEMVDQASWDQLAELVAGTRSRLVLSPPDIHTIRVKLPKAARSRLRAAIALQLGELSPLDPALVDWAMHRPRRVGETLEIAVTLVRRARLSALAVLFSEHGVPMPAVWAYADERFVRLTSGYDGSRARNTWRSGHRLLLAALLLVASVPITTILGATIIAHIVDHGSDTLEAELAPKLQLERRARESEALRHAVAPLAAVPLVTATLVDLANRLPQTAWVRSAARRADGALALTIDATDPDQVRGGLEDAATGFRELNQVPTDDGRIRVDYLLGAR